MMPVNEASVLPDPVGAAMRAFSPPWMSGMASFWGGVKKPPFSGTNSPNCSVHHS